jgi:hypothetical protein
MYKKPTIVFGEPHYSVIPLVHNCDTPEYLSQVIQTALTDHEHNDEVLLEYLTALFEKSFKIPSNSAQSPKENAKKRTESIFPYLIEQIDKIDGQLISSL